MLAEREREREREREGREREKVNFNLFTLVSMLPTARSPTGNGPNPCKQKIHITH
jgi:hypothetical protein